MIMLIATLVGLFWTTLFRLMGFHGLFLLFVFCFATGMTIFAMCLAEIAAQKDR